MGVRSALAVRRSGGGDAPSGVRGDAEPGGEPGTVRSVGVADRESCASES